MSHARFPGREPARHGGFERIHIVRGNARQDWGSISLTVRNEAGGYLTDFKAFVYGGVYTDEVRSVNACGFSWDLEPGQLRGYRQLAGRFTGRATGR